MKNPENILKYWRGELPSINKKIAEKINLHSKKRDYWLLSNEEWIEVLKETNGELGIFHLSICKAILTWQYNKSIYKFNEILYDSLIKTTLNKIPIDVIYKVPYQCIYIEVPEKKLFIDNECIHGFFVIIDRISAIENVINFICNVENADSIVISNFPLLLADRNIEELIENTITKAILFCEEERINKKLLTIFLSLLLYLCSEAPDILLHEKNKDIHSYNIKTRHGQKLLPAEKTKIFNVGDEIAKKLQNYEKIGLNNKEMRAHIRKAHWHGYWYGKNRENFKYNWIPPTLINIETQKEIS